MVEKLKHPAQNSESGHYLDVINIRQFGGVGELVVNQDRSEISAWLTLWTAAMYTY